MTTLCLAVGILVLASLVVCQTSPAGRTKDPDEIYFPDSVPSGSRAGSDLSKRIRFMKRINNAETVEEFLDLVGGTEDVPYHYGFNIHLGRDDLNSSLTGRIDTTGLERSNAEIAKQAKCMPELQPVPVLTGAVHDPSTIYFPSCIRIKRCGGCCSHSLLSCQPLETIVRNFEVLVTKIDEDMRLYGRSKEIIPLEEHTKCKCDCRIKAEHCSPKQDYIEEECRCACNNIDEEEKCKRNSDIKLWDPEVCTCLCRNHQECNTGFYFDQNTCSCKEVSISRNWFGGTRRTGYTIGQTKRPENVPPVIISLDAADPKRKHKDEPDYK